MSLEDMKPTAPEPPTKSSMEILSELFSTFDAEPPIIVKKEATEESAKKHKKNKKKHKHHKDKKHHKKKSRKRKRSASASTDGSAVDLTDILIKKEKENDPTDLNSVCLQEAVGNIKADISETTDKTESNLLENEDKSGCEDLDMSGLKKNKIVIKDLKFSSIFDATILAIKEKEKLKKTEEGELSLSELTGDEKSDDEVERSRSKKEKHKKKHKHCKHEEEKAKKRKRSVRTPSRERSKKRSRSRSPVRSKDNARKTHKSRSKDRHKRKSKDHDGKDQHARRKSKDYDSFRRSRENDGSKSRERSSYKSKERNNDHRKSKERDDHEDRKRKHKENAFYKADAYINSGDKDEKWFMKDRYRGYTERDRDRERRFRDTSEENSTYIDKKKLLEIARKNAIQMMKSGSLPGALTLGPQAQEKVIAAIKSGGKTVEELTDFCKTLSRKEELGELSSVSEDNISDSDGEKPFHHPFQIKERPVSITMNIKNSVPLPIKNSQERASELRMQFPVSSGQQHRKTENEWVPVSPKKSESSVGKIATLVAPPAVGFVATPLPIEAPPLPPPPQPVIPATTIPQSTAPAVIPAVPRPQVFPTVTSTEANIDVATIVSQRLSAMRKLQENPNDVQALNIMYKAQKEMNFWAESKQQIGQFTGSTGAQILTQAELSSGFQAWARKDQLQTAAPVSGGMGMHLLQKMGWKPGEGLGKEKTGALEPLLLEVKLDKKGIVAKEEQKKKQPKTQKAAAAIAAAAAVKTSSQGKHPVSLLGEYASKHKLGAPQYDLCFECGPDHKKNFLFRVILNGTEYKPQIASPNKKEAKASAALICLQQLGILQP